MKSVERFGDDDSKYRETMIEFKFLSDLIQQLARGGRKLEILRGHADSYGYDVVLKVDNDTKYVQLKSVKKGGKVPNWRIHRSLLERGNGTVILIVIYYSGRGMRLKYRILSSDGRKTALIRELSPDEDSGKYCKITRGYLLKETTIYRLAARLFPVGKNLKK